MDIKVPKVGEILTGTVVKVTQEEVLVDVGYMFEGSIYKDHLSTKKVNDAREFVKVGDSLDAKVTKISHGDQTNVLLLSRLDIEKAEVREKHIEELQVGKTILATVKRTNPGGLELDYHGISLFMPNSMIDLQNTTDEDKKALLGSNIEVLILESKVVRGKETFVVNRKQVLYDNLKKQEKAELSSIKVGEVVQGVVKSVLDFGAVVKLTDHVDGLLHISECSQYHITDVNEVVKVGDELSLKVIKVQGKKISLSLKALQENPWNIFLKNHKIGDKVTGTVVKKMQFGMLLEVEREITGLLSRNDYSWDPQDNLAGRVEIGSKIEVEIISINKEKKQFGLSKKHLDYNPWADLKFRVGEVVSATVKSFQDKGAIVEVEGVDAYLPIGEVSDEHISRVDEALKLGDILSVEITTFFPKEWKMTVSRKKIVEKAARKEYEEQLKENVSSNQSLADLFEKFKK